MKLGKLQRGMLLLWFLRGYYYGYVKDKSLRVMNPTVGRTLSSSLQSSQVLKFLKREIFMLLGKRAHIIVVSLS